MLSRRRIGLLSLAVLCFALLTAVQKEPDDKVKESIKSGMTYLRKIENGKGNFEHTTRLSAIRPGGVTALATVALLKTGVPADDPLIQRSLKYLRTVEPADTYAVGLQTMAFCLAKDKEDRKLVERNLKWLKDSASDRGWGYNAQIRSPDHCINYYVLMGLREAKRAGFLVDQDMLKNLRDHYAENDRGQWGYRTSPASRTMTSAGLYNLLVTIELLGEKPSRQEQQITEKALKWLGDEFPADLVKDGAFREPFYCLHCIRSACEKAEHREFGKKDWRTLGSAYLVSKQQTDGSWNGNNRGLDGWPPVATSLALLFLAPK